MSKSTRTPIPFTMSQGYRPAPIRKNGFWGILALMTIWAVCIVGCTIVCLGAVSFIASLVGRIIHG